MPRRTPRPGNTDPLLTACRHCGAYFAPPDSELAGVCPDCLQSRYVACDRCGSPVLAESAVATADSREHLCPSCADGSTTRCRRCGATYASDGGFIWDNRGAHLCPGCAEGYARCECCGEHYPARELAERDGGGRICWRCSCSEGDGPISSYTYKPAPIFHRAEGESDNSLVLGIELEMDNGDAEAAAARIRSLYGSEWLYFKRDGSLEEGVELVTHPISPLVLMSPQGRGMWARIAEAALAEGMRSHDTRTCGLHVHVNRDFFGTGETASALAEYKLLTVADRFFEPLVIFSRRKRELIDQWAGRCELDSARTGWLASAKRASRRSKMSRYHAVNTVNAHTIEFRLFRGTLRVETLLATFQFVDGLCHLAAASSPGQIERMTWYELADGVLASCQAGSGELEAYLIERELMTEGGDGLCA